MAALRSWHFGEVLNHIVDGAVAPFEAVEQLRAIGIEQPAAVGLHLALRAEVHAVAKQREQREQGILKERPVRIGHLQRLGTLATSKVDQAVERVVLAVGEHVDGQQAQVLGVQDEQQAVQQAERLLILPLQ